MIKPQTLKFLNNLRQYNNRDWFEAHRDEYQLAKENMNAFAEAVKAKLSETDAIERYRVYRIYRDLRFTKDRSRPYKEHWDGYLYRAGAERRGGYVFRIAPGLARPGLDGPGLARPAVATAGLDGPHGGSQVGGGFFGPNREDLLRIRQELAFDSQPLDDITQHPDFTKAFGTLQGEEVKTAPQGFSQEHPNIRWIRKKQFYALRSFSDEEVLRSDFVEQTVTTFRALRPFFDYMSEVLTTNADGEVV